MPETASTQRAFGHGLRTAIQRGRVGEAALVRAAQRGSQDAVAELFDRHWNGAYRAALLVTGDRAAAEDIAQEAFLAGAAGAAGFDLRRPLRPWLHRIVVNRAIDWSRARALRNEVGAERAGEAAAPAVACHRAFGEDMAAALMRLGPEQRAVVVMRYLLELHAGRDRRALGLPRGTVNSRLRRGLDALGVAMEEVGPMNERELRDRAARRRAGGRRGGRRRRERSWRVVQAALHAGAAPGATPAATAALGGARRGSPARAGRGRRRRRRHDARPAPSGNGCGACSASASPTPKPALVHVPGGGRLLVRRRRRSGSCPPTGPSGAWAPMPGRPGRRTGSSSSRGGAAS